MNERDTYAFPLDTEDFIQYGMTLRDYFAAKVIGHCISEGNFNYPKEYKEAFKDAAFKAYKLADAMLKERNNYEN